jgi:lysophospholipase L1-like esterase
VPYLTVSEIRDQQLEKARAFRPDAVLITAGGNDAFREYDALLRPLTDAARP